MRRVQYRGWSIYCIVFVLILLITTYGWYGLNALPSFVTLPERAVTLAPLAPDSSLTDTHDQVENKLAEFQGVLQLMQHNGVDTATYQQQYHEDQAAFQTAQSPHALSGVLNQLDDHLAPTSLVMAEALAQYQVQQFHQEVMSWGQSHQYHDTYDKQNYPLDYEYMSMPNGYGLGSNLDYVLQSAQTVADYQAVITQVTDDQDLLNALEDNVQDTTSWQQPHSTDQRLLSDFHATQGQVIVVSLTEQALRLYQDGKLTKAFQVVTGLYQRPTPPGFYHINAHAPVSLFISFEQPDSEFYFPPTNVYYTMNFGVPSEGYFLHASPWRTYYGPGDNLPHYDPLNENTESRNGSHGCVNLPLNEEQWLYNQVADGTDLIIY